MPNPKPSIVQIIDRLETGGAEKIVVFLANLLYQNGHTVRVITTVSNGPQYQYLHKGISAICLHRKWKWNPYYMLQLKRACKGFDIIHLHGAPTLRYVLLTKLIFGLKHKFIYHEHDGQVNNKPAKWYYKYFLQKKEFIATSQTVADWAIHTVKLNVNRISLLLNTIEKQNCGKNQKRPLHSLVLVSNILPHKNIEFSLEVLKKLLHFTKLDYQLTIIGKKYDEQYFAYLTNQINHNLLADHVSFITDCNQVAPLLHHYSIGLHTSFEESGPLVLTEYLSQNLPFLSFNTGEVSKIICRHFPAFFQSDFDANKWAASIIKLEKEYLNPLATKQNMQVIFDQYFSSHQYYLNYSQLLNHIEISHFDKSLN